MNRNPARPKFMLPCTCESRYMECNCEWLRLRKGHLPGCVYIPLMVLTVSMIIVGLNYLFRG
jgi:hypothetical protein